MKKIFLAGVTAAACVMLFGCSSEKAVPKEEKSPEATSQPFTERNVEHSEGTYIFDKASLLSAEDIQACNDYAGWLYENKLINAAVVTTNDLEGKSPWDYAVDSFNEIYEGKGSGLVILINNATNEDIVYRTGSCLTNISQKSADNAMFWATKEIMGNSYRNAVMRLLQLGELCSSLPNDEILKTYYKRRYNDVKGIMLMLDINSRTIIAYSDGKLPDKLSAQLKSANELAAHDDYIAAVNKAIDLVEK